MPRKNKSKSDKMHPLTRVSLFFYDRMKLTLFIWIAIVVAGFSSYSFWLNREGFPPIQFPLGVASGTYFVNDAEKVDRDITKPISEALKDVEEITSLETSAGENFYSIFASFDESVQDSEKATEILKNEIEESGLMPKEAKTDYLAIDPAAYLFEYDMLISVYNTSALTTQQLESKANELAKDISGKEGIEEATVESLFLSNVNPATGQEETIKGQFAKIAVNEGGQVNYYESVTVGINGDETLDVIELSETVNASLDEVADNKKYEPVGVTVSADFAPSIITQINSLQSNMFTALLVVVLVCFVLITWRASVIIALIILSVMATTFLILLLAGMTINTITLFALVLVLGLFVDDATIIAEAIDASRSKKKKPRDVVKEAMNKVAPASLAGSITTILVFVPLLFVTGILGEFIRILPLTIIIALVTSYLLSIALVPFMARYILLNVHKKESRNPISKLEERFADKIASIPLLFRTNKLKAWVVSIALFSVSLVFLNLSGFYAQKVSFNIFPPSKDSDTLQIEGTFTPGTTIGQAVKITDQIDEITKDIVGENLEGAAYFESDERTTSILIELVPFTERDTTAPEIQEQLEPALDELEGIDTRIVQVDSGPPEDEFPFKVQIFGEDAEKSLAAANSIESYIMGKEVSRQNGTTATITGTKVAVDGTINRIDSKKVVEVQAGFDAEDTTALVNAAQELVEEEYDDAKLSKFGLTSESLDFDFGQESENQDSFSSLGVVGPLALLGIFLLLAFQFRSLLQPLLIFVAIPFSFFGVMAGLFYTDNPISFFVMIGFFGLMGISINNTILLTDYANQEHKSGKGLVESISAAIKKRFRPLLATSTTTVVALLPLALSDPFWEALAFTMIFGLISSTLLVIISFPYYYLFLEGAKARFLKRLKKLVRRNA